MHDRLGGSPSGLANFVVFLLLWSRHELLRHREKAVQLEKGVPIVIIASVLDANAFCCSLSVVV